jgi:hypothetical protein
MKAGEGSGHAHVAVANRMKDKETPTEARHLTENQREEIEAGLQNSATGPVSMTAPAIDKEAVSYQAEIASVLEDMGCDVKIDNARTKAQVQEIPVGVEMTIKEETVRPVHASRIVRIFRRAGVVIATRVNSMRRNNDTLYITIGPTDAPALVPPVPPGAEHQPWWKSLATLFGPRK